MRYRTTERKQTKNSILKTTPKIKAVISKKTILGDTGWVE